jgi:hypothetical protein
MYVCIELHILSCKVNYKRLRLQFAVLHLALLLINTSAQHIDVLV